MKKNLYAKWIAGFVLAVPVLGTANSDLRLLDFSKTGDYKGIKLLLLDKSADVNVAKADGTTALHWAAHQDDPEIVDMLIQSGANASPANVYGVTPLHLACTNRSAVMVNKLLQAGADPNAALWTGETVLMTCARTGATTAVAALLSNEADPNARESNQGQTAIMWAAAMGHSEVVKLLIDNGADISSTTTATVDRLPNTCRICSWEPSPGGFTTLLFAARSGDLDSARLLLEAGASPDEQTEQHGNSLVVASAGGHEDLALYLLKMGANPDAADENGVTALHHSFRRALSRMHGILYDPVYRVRPDNMPRLTRALLEAGASTNVQINRSYNIGPGIRDRCESISGMQGATPFMLAAIAADIPLMRLLKESGADPTIYAKDGTTALVAAVQAACTIPSQRGIKTNEAEVNLSLIAVKEIVDMGIDINAVNNSGESAMHMAAFSGAEPVVKYLAERGVQVDLKNKTGETPWSMASGISAEIGTRGSYGIHQGTAALLLSLGATPITREQMYITDGYSNFSDSAISIDVNN